MIDLVVEGGTVLTVDGSWNIYDPGYLEIDQGRIVGLGPAGDAAAAEARRRRARRHVDARGKLVLPGFVNVHTHVSMAAFRGAGEDMPDRLFRYIFPLERDLVTPDLVYWSALHSLAEMARSGTTAFADMYYFEHEVALAAEKAGMRGLLGETILGQPAPDASEPYGGFEYTESFVDRWKGHPLLTPCIAPHAPYTVDAAGLARVRDTAERLDLRVMMHVAEMDFEHARFSKESGSVIRYLDSIPGLLSPRLLAVHMIFVDDEDIGIAADRGLAVAHCPASNAKSGRPISPAWRMAGAGIPLGLATDGPLSGNGMDLEGVLNLYPKLQKVREGKRDILPAREALAAATIGGAKAIGMGDSIGSLEKGKRADFILVDLDDFNIQPIHDWYSAVVYSLKPHNVESVFVEGREIVSGRRMTGFDQDEVAANMRRIATSCAEYLARKQ